jgi:hypothetical protein
VDVSDPTAVGRGPRRRARAAGETTSSGGAELGDDVRLLTPRAAVFRAGVAVAADFLAVGPLAASVATPATGGFAVLAAAFLVVLGSATFLATRGWVAFLAGDFVAAGTFFAAVFLAAARFAGGSAPPAASATTASPSCGSTTEAMLGTAQSMLRRAGAKLATTSVTASPIFITSRALRGGGSDISRRGTYPNTSPIFT